MSASAVISPAHSDSDSEGGGRFFRWVGGTVGRRRLASVRGAFALAPPAQRWAPLAALDAPIKFRLGGGVRDIDGDHVEGILEMETRAEANASLPT